MKGQGHRDGDVDAHHAHFDFPLEAPGGAAIPGKDCRAVGVRAGIDEFHGLLEAGATHDAKDRSENFFSIDRHLWADTIKQTGPDEEAVFVSFNFESSAIGDQRGALFDAFVDQAPDSVALGKGNHRAHFALGVAGGSDAQRFDALLQ